MGTFEKILEQLGGNKFLSMTGCHSFVSDGNLIFQLPKNTSNAKYLKISLNNDTYNLTFSKLNKEYEEVIVDKVYDVYAKDLQKVFTEKTGLLTHL